MSGGYYGGWDPAPFLNQSTYKFPTEHYTTRSGKHYMDFRDWAGTLGDQRDQVLKGIYMSARMMKYNPMATQALKKNYSMVASAALRAMSPEGKFNVKRLFVDYNDAKKKMAKEVREFKQELGYNARNGIAGRVAYWNKLVGLPMTDPTVPELLSGVDGNLVRQREDWGVEGPWSKTTYAEYQAAMKDQMNAMRDKINTMTPTEYLAYQTRNRALKDYRKALSKKRTTLRDAWKARKDVEWGAVEDALYDPGSAAILADTLKSSNNYKGLTAEMLNPYLKSSKGMMDAYTGTIEGFADRPVPVHAPIVPFQSQTFAPISLTSRAPADFKALAAADVNMGNNGNA